MIDGAVASKINLASGASDAAQASAAARLAEAVMGSALMTAAIMKRFTRIDPNAIVSAQG